MPFGRNDKFFVKRLDRMNIDHFCINTFRCQLLRCLQTVVDRKLSAEVMVNDRTCQDNVVDVAEMLIDPNRSSAGSRTEVLKVFLLVAETVVHLQTRSNVLANCLNHFFFCIICAKRESERTVSYVVDTSDCQQYMAGGGEAGSGRY